MTPMRRLVRKSPRVLPMPAANPVASTAPMSPNTDMSGRSSPAVSRSWIAYRTASARVSACARSTPSVARTTGRWATAHTMKIGMLAL